MTLRPMITPTSAAVQGAGRCFTSTMLATSAVKRNIIKGSTQILLEYQMRNGSTAHNREASTASGAFHRFFAVQNTRTHIRPNSMHCANCTEYGHQPLLSASNPAMKSGYKG